VDCAKMAGGKPTTVVEKREAMKRKREAAAEAAEAAEAEEEEEEEAAEAADGGDGAPGGDDGGGGGGGGGGDDDEQDKTKKPKKILSKKALARARATQARSPTNLTPLGFVVSHILRCLRQSSTPRRAVCAACCRCSCIYEETSRHATWAFPKDSFRLIPPPRPLDSTANFV